MAKRKKEKRREETTAKFLNSEKTRGYVKIVIRNVPNYVLLDQPM